MFGKIYQKYQKNIEKLANDEITKLIKNNANEDIQILINNIKSCNSFSEKSKSIIELILFSKLEYKDTSEDKILLYVFYLIFYPYIEL